MSWLMEDSRDVCVRLPSKPGVVAWSQTRIRVPYVRTRVPYVAQSQYWYQNYRTRRSRRESISCFPGRSFSYLFCSVVLFFILRSRSLLFSSQSFVALIARNCLFRYHGAKECDCVTPPVIRSMAVSYRPLLSVATPHRGPPYKYVSRAQNNLYSTLFG